MNNSIKTAIFAAGNFWDTQSYFDKIPGVIETETGYIGGHVEDPTYEEVSSDKTGHAEAVLIKFDQSKISYEKLVKHFFRMHDPTQYNKQGADIGSMYRSSIFYLDEDQHEIAEKVMQESQDNHNNEIVTEIVPADEFFTAEEYHQKYNERTGKSDNHVPYKDIE